MVDVYDPGGDRHDDDSYASGSATQVSLPYGSIPGDTGWSRSLLFPTGDLSLFFPKTRDKLVQPRKHKRLSRLTRRSYNCGYLDKPFPF